MRRNKKFVLSEKEYSFLDFALRSKKFNIGSLAFEIGVSKSYFSKMLNGRVNFGKKYRHHIYETLDKDETIDFLLYDRSFIGYKKIYLKTKENNFVMNDMEYSYFNKVLREKGVTQKDLARRIGITQGRVSEMINGKSNLGKDYRYKIYEVLGKEVAIEFLLYDRSFIGDKKISDKVAGTIIQKKINEPQGKIYDGLFKYACRGTSNIFKHLPLDRKQEFLERQRDFGYEVASHSPNGNFMNNPILLKNDLGSIDDLMDTAFANLAEEIANVYVTIPAKLKQEIMFKQSDLGYDIDVATRPFYKKTH
jgi:transcriptional regulator with XRE-family HTH domain